MIYRYDICNDGMYESEEVTLYHQKKFSSEELKEMIHDEDFITVGELKSYLIEQGFFELEVEKTLLVGDYVEII